jgi:hypothetical protein
MADKTTHSAHRIWDTSDPDNQLGPFLLSVIIGLIALGVSLLIARGRV